MSESEGNSGKNGPKLRESLSHPTFACTVSFFRLHSYGFRLPWPIWFLSGSEFVGITALFCQDLPEFSANSLLERSFLGSKRS